MFPVRPPAWASTSSAPVGRPARYVAEAVRLEGEAEAAAIAVKGGAEAEAMQKKAAAYGQYGEAAILQMPGPTAGPPADARPSRWAPGPPRATSPSPETLLTSHP